MVKGSYVGSILLTPSFLVDITIIYASSITLVSEIQKMHHCLFPTYPHVHCTHNTHTHTTHTHTYTHAHTQTHKIAKMKRADSVSSVGSMTSLSRPSRGDYDITGDILLGVEYKRKQLMIHVKKARGLAVPDTGSRTVNSYVKIYLLPDRSKHSKRKTNVKKKTINPVYGETLKVSGEENS